MDREGFQQRLKKRGLSDPEIEEHISHVKEFERFLQEQDPSTSLESAGAQQLREYIGRLYKEGRITYATILALARYTLLIKNYSVFLPAIELIDGAEVMDNLYKKVGSMLGYDIQKAVFDGIELPRIGTPNSEKPQITKTVIERMETLIDPDTCHQILSSGLRDLPIEPFLVEREKYLACTNFDEFLQQKGDAFIAELQNIKQEDGLYFTQSITDEVIEFVENNPEIRQGVREGNILYETKIPYMAVEYLAESDETLKRYYYCHCPWVRESIRTGEVQISVNFCNCSAGYHKHYWQVVLDQPLEGWVVESVLKGDPLCRLAIRLPESVD